MGLKIGPLIKTDTRGLKIGPRPLLKIGPRGLKLGPWPLIKTKPKSLKLDPKPFLKIVARSATRVLSGLHQSSTKVKQNHMCHSGPLQSVVDPGAVNATHPCKIDPRPGRSYGP